MSVMASRITSLTIIYSTVYSGADQRKHQSSASLAFVWGIHRGPVDSPHKWPVTRKIFPFGDVIMISQTIFFRCIFVNEKFCIWIKNSLKFVPEGPINIIPALVQAMVWCRPGASHYPNQCRPDSLTHIWGTRGDELTDVFKCPNASMN